MATGGASALATPAGLHPLMGPLLWLAIAEAVVLPLSGIASARRAQRDMRSLLTATGPEGRFGDFTVPVGLAVIGTGLAGLGSQGARDAAVAAGTLAWMATLVVVAVVVVPVIAQRPRLEGIEGAWFLAPAAFLADAIVTVGAARALPAPDRAALGWLALVGCGIGVVTYVVVLALAALRVQRSGLGASHRAPWWISAGCAGLAAAAVGEVARAVPSMVQLPAAAPAGFAPVTVALWALASVLMIPVVVVSVVHLARWRGPQGAPVWPPTFSTAVYALGAIGAGRVAPAHRLGPAHLVGTVGVDAGLATIALWLVTAALWLVSVGVPVVLDTRTRRRVRRGTG